MRRSAVIVLFWGSLWGLMEATLGYLLHFAAVAIPGLPGFLMFPFAFALMHRAVKEAGVPSAAFYASIVAASVKLTDFLVPGHDPIRVSNPALAILMEGLAVYAVMAYRDRKREGLVPVHAFGMGVLWRAMFSAYLWAISLFGLPAALVTSGPWPLLRFIFLESFVNAVIMGGYLAMDKKLGIRRRTASTVPVLAVGLLAAALAANYLL